MPIQSFNACIYTHVFTFIYSNCTFCKQFLTARLTAGWSADLLLLKLITEARHLGEDGEVTGHHLKWASGVSLC